MLIYCYTEVDSTHLAVENNRRMEGLMFTSEVHRFPKANASEATFIWFLRFEIWAGAAKEPLDATTYRNIFQEFEIGFWAGGEKALCNVSRPWLHIAPTCCYYPVILALIFPLRWDYCNGWGVEKGRWSRGYAMRYGAWKRIPCEAPARAWTCIGLT